MANEKQTKIITKVGGHLASGERFEAGDDLSKFKITDEEMAVLIEMEAIEGKE